MLLIGPEQGDLKKRKATYYSLSKKDLTEQRRQILYISLSDLITTFLAAVSPLHMKILIYRPTYTWWKILTELIQELN